MKQLLLLITTILLLSMLTASAQTTGGFKRGNKQQMLERMKQRMKNELELNDAQADSVMKINRWYQGKIQAVKDDESLTEKEREMQVATLQQQRKTALKTILTDEQIAKLQTMLQNMRMRQQQQDEADEEKTKE